MRFLKKYEVGSFYIGTLVLSGLLLVLQLSAFSHTELTFMQFAPGIMALIFVSTFLGGSGIGGFLAGVFLRKVRPGWIILSMVIPILFISTSDIFYRVFTNQEFGQIGVHGQKIGLWPVLAVLLGCVGEELGWRGYLLGKLEKTQNALMSNVFLGVLWGIWHLRFNEGIGFILFIFMTVELSIIMAWLLEKGNRSLLTAVLFHSSFNLSWMFFYGATANPTLRFVQVFVLGVPVIYLIRTHFKHRVKEKNSHKNSDKFYGFGYNRSVGFLEPLETNMYKKCLKE